MFKKVLAGVVLGCVIVSGVALAQDRTELESKMDQIGEERTTKCIVLAKTTVNCYKYGVDLDKNGAHKFMDEIESFLSSAGEQRKEGVKKPNVWSSSDIDKWEDICITSYNAGVNDRVNHGWNPRFFNIAISNYGSDLARTCVMNDYFGE